jgi:hypothetical protein
VFLADSSTTVSKEDYKKEKTVVKRMARYFNVSPGKSRAAFITYGNRNLRATGFNDYSNIQEFDSRVEQAPSMGGRRRIDRALEAAVTELRQSRPISRKIVVLLTSGRETPESDTKSMIDVSEPLRRLGVSTYVMAIGRNPNGQELRPVVDKPEDIFFIPDFDSLPSKITPVTNEILKRSGKI